MDQQPAKKIDQADTLGPAEFSQDQQLETLTKEARQEIFSTLLHGKALSVEQTTRAFEMMIGGEAHESEIGALLALLATRVPTSDELLGAARVMRAHVDRVESTCSADEIVDTAGTGGAPKTFNVSTVAAVIAAAAGAKVAKHGNRSRTGRGSAEVLQQLGVNVDADRTIQAKCLDEVGICFCFAIHHHPATRHVIGARKALGFATMFNLLGPLTNPAGATRQVMGVYASKFVRPIAEALRDLGSVRAIVAHSEDGLDELTITAPTHLAHVEDGSVREETIDAASLGLATATLDDLQASDLADAADIFRAILDGSETGPKRDMAVLNAAATLLVAGAADSLANGIEQAQATIADAKAIHTLQYLIEVSNAGQ